jgi:hypothetical protein
VRAARYGSKKRAIQRSLREQPEPFLNVYSDYQSRDSLYVFLRLTDILSVIFLFAIGKSGGCRVP